MIASHRVDSYQALPRAPRQSEHISERFQEAPQSSEQLKCRSSSRAASRTEPPRGAAPPDWLRRSRARVTPMNVQNRLVDQEKQQIFSINVTELLLFVFI